MPKLEPYTKDDIPRGFKKWIGLARRAIVKTPDFLEGTGSPEGSVTAKRWTFYMDTGGSPPTVVYVKQSASGNTGWQSLG